MHKFRNLFDTPLSYETAFNIDDNHMYVMIVCI